MSTTGQRNRAIRLGTSIILGLAIATTLTISLVLDIVRVQAELYLTLSTLFVLSTVIVYRLLGRIIAAPGLPSFSTKIAFIAGPLVFAGVLVMFRPSAASTPYVTDGNSNLELHPAALESWGDQHFGFEMHPVAEGTQSPSRLRVRLPARLRWTGGKLRVRATQPDWAVFDPEGAVYEGTDGVDLSFSTEDSPGLRPFHILTLDLHNNASHRLWQEVVVNTPPAQNLIVDALQKGNDWYDRAWLVLEVEEDAGGIFALADWLSLATVISLSAFGLAILSSATPGSLLQAGSSVLKTPFLNEFALLKERSDSMEKLAADLHLQREATQQELAAAETERDRLKRLTETLQAELQRLKLAEKEASLQRRPESWADILKISSLSETSRIRPGTFALLHYTGDGSGFGAVVDRAADFDMTHKGVYDPIADQILLTGGSPNSEHNVLVRYDIDESRWSVEPVTGQWIVGPAYDAIALNPEAREMYSSARLRSHNVRRLSLDSGQWSELPKQPESIGFVPSEPSAEYFPDRDELLWLQKQRVGVWKRTSQSWALLSVALIGLGERGAIARYSPAGRCVLLLGGATTNTAPPEVSHTLYKYDAQGAITRMSDSPPSVKIYPNRALVTVDPVTGNLIVLQAVLGPDLTDFTDRLDLWEYNCVTDTWTRMDVSQVPTPSGWWKDNRPAGVLVVPVAKYGVMMFLSLAGARSSVFLYKR